VLLEGGRLIANGTPQHVIHRYTDLLESETRAGHVAATRRDATMAPASPVVASTSPREAFAAETPSRDGCRQRAGYNPAEYRQGAARAEIVDFALASDKRFDVAIVKSGEPLEIHIKARYHARVDRPHFGFSLKTVDGVMLYALNTHFENVKIAAADAGDVVSCKFTVPMHLPHGHYFLDLGADEQTGPGRFTNLHRRCSIAHVQVLQSREFNGLVDLRAEFTETRRQGAAARAA
jgi:lipopolysaccharide transport system ATP-binding protein